MNDLTLASPAIKELLDSDPEIQKRLSTIAERQSVATLDEAYQEWLRELSTESIRKALARKGKLIFDIADEIVKGVSKDDNGYIVFDRKYENGILELIDQWPDIDPALVEFFTKNPGIKSSVEKIALEHGLANMFDAYQHWIGDYNEDCETTPEEHYGTNCLADVSRAYERLSALVRLSRVYDYIRDILSLDDPTEIKEQLGTFIEAEHDICPLMDYYSDVLQKISCEEGCTWYPEEDIMDENYPEWREHSSAGWEPVTRWRMKRPRSLKQGQ